MMHCSALSFAVQFQQCNHTVQPCVAALLHIGNGGWLVREILHIAFFVWIWVQMYFVFCIRVTVAGK